MQTESQTYVTKLIVCFRKFSELDFKRVKKKLDARYRSQADRKADGRDLPSRNDCFQLISDIREELFSNVFSNPEGNCTHFLYKAGNFEADPQCVTDYVALLYR